MRAKVVNYVWYVHFNVHCIFLCLIGVLGYAHVTPLNVQEFSESYPNVVFYKVNVDENDVR